MKQRTALTFALALAWMAISCKRDGPIAQPSPPSSPPAPRMDMVAPIPTSTAPVTVESQSRVARTPPGEISSVPQALTELGSQLASNTKTDPVLGAIGQDVGKSAKTLADAVPENSAVQTQASAILQGLSKNQDQQALQAYDKLSQLQLTPEQTRLARNLKDAVSAFVVQRNFSSLDGAGNEVAQIVTAMRQGDATTAIQALQKVAANAQLTVPQKELLGTLVQQYAPSLQKAGTAVEEKLKGLNPL